MVRATPAVLGQPDYASRRVARWIAHGTRARDDPRTLKLWAQAAGVSVRTLQYGCFAARVAPTACRDLARLLRLATGTAGDEWDPLTQLNADPRTVDRLLARGGLSQGGAPPTIEEFLSGQAVVSSHRLLRELAEALRTP